MNPHSPMFQVPMSLQPYGLELQATQRLLHQRGQLEAKQLCAAGRQLADQFLTRHWVSSTFKAYGPASSKTKICLLSFSSRNMCAPWASLESKGTQF